MLAGVPLGCTPLTCCRHQDWKTVNPTWLPMMIPEAKLCGSNRDARLMIEIYHRRKYALRGTSVAAAPLLDVSLLMRSGCSFCVVRSHAGIQAASLQPWKRRYQSCWTYPVVARCPSPGLVT